MQHRPTSLTIIGWFLIVTSAFGLLGMLRTINNPMVTRIYAHSPLPLSVHLAIGVAGALITIVCGFGVLKGFNWSRFVYVGWSLIGFAISFATIPVMSFVLLGLAFFLVMVFFLFRPAANDWFTRGAAAKV